MKNTIIYLFLAASLFLVSCEEVIEIEVNEADIQLVIEGDLTDENRMHSVKLSQTGSYFEPGNYPVIEGATLTLTNASGESETLNDVGQGVYQIENIKGEIGETYTLTVSHEGETYEAISSMPSGITLDTLVFNTRPAGPFGEEGIVMVVNFQDPPGERNYVFFELYLNDELVEGIFLYDDATTDGLEEAGFAFFTASPEPGDRVRIKALSMDKDVYDYFNTLVEIAGGGFAPGAGSAAPANPESNFTPRALGYFGAFSVSEIEGVVP